MPKTSDERRTERREQILTAAWRCFQHDGLHATTMDHIITASGLSAGALYSYFPGKDALIRAAVTASLSGLRDLLEPLLRRGPSLSPEALLRDVAAAINRFSARDGFDLKRLALLGWSEAQRNEGLCATMRGFYAAFRDQLAELCRSWAAAGVIPPATNPDDQAKALLALILGFVVQEAGAAACRGAGPCGGDEVNIAARCRPPAILSGQVGGLARHIRCRRQSA